MRGERWRGGERIERERQGEGEGGGEGVSSIILLAKINGC